FVVRNCLLKSGEDDREGTWDGCRGWWHRRNTGVLLEKLTHGTVESCIVLTKRTGIHISKSEGIVVQNNEITEAWRGILIEKSQNCVITDNRVSNVLSGICNIKSDGSTISGSLIHNSGIGIYLVKSEGGLITGNEVFDSFWGALACKSAAFTLSSNSMHDLYTGIRLVCSTGFVITWNEIMDNKGIGIDLIRTDGCTIHRNTIAENSKGNARDRIGDCDEMLENMWDDGVDTGNWWGDYSGTGAYVIPGDHGSVDRYPNGMVPQDTTRPTWDQTPTDQVIEVDELFSYNVNASDENGIDHYWVSDTTDFAIDDNGVITVPHELEVGSYNLEVRAYDPSGNYVSAEFVLTVQDTDPPVVVGPADLSYKVGETGNVLAWQAADSSPDTYEILMDGTLLKSGPWNSSSEVVEISVDGLAAGTYVYTASFIDASGNVASDEVTVTVIKKIIITTTPTVTTVTRTSDNTNPETDPLITGTMTAGGVVSGTIAVLALAGLSKRE
ncbi:MAG: right-handed parallel beta-helix repeat-containing protein, partial [Candidatus Thorarchaeota archaeon]